MPRDFGPAVASLLAGCSGPTPIRPVSDQAPSSFSEHLTLTRVIAGVGADHAKLSHHLIEAARASAEFRPDLIDAAIDWARSSARASHVGMYQLASALLFRAGALAGIGFNQPAEVDAAEALGLLDVLADAGYEHAATGIVQAAQALAQHGIGCGPAAPFSQQEV